MPDGHFLAIAPAASVVAREAPAPRAAIKDRLGFPGKVASARETR